MSIKLGLKRLSVMDSRFFFPLLRFELGLLKQTRGV